MKVMHAGPFPSTAGGVPKIAPARRRSAAWVEKFRISIFQNSTPKRKVGI